jgi:F-type H+-transporting ATPase subunit beta
VKIFCSVTKNCRISSPSLVWTNFRKKINSLVHRARRVQRFLSQPFHVAEQFTGIKGVLVPIEETIKGFNMIMDGQVDEYPEAAFNLVGTIEEAIAKGEKLIAEASK